MLMEWLEPSIEKGIDKAFDSYTESDKYNEANKKIKSILMSCGEGIDVDSIYVELEGLFLSMVALSCGISYRSGFKDAITIYSHHKPE